MAELKSDLVGMYVHQHWPYRHPYAARTWTEADWRGYAGGLCALGYNAVMIWPVLETMPSPLLASDRAHLEKLQRVIATLQGELGMAVYIALCPNVVAVDEVARRAPFEERHFFYSDRRVDPGDAAAVAEMLRRRTELLEPLKAADGVAIIDSDPGGFPGSTNAEFAELLAGHRRVLDGLRPGIELVYWMHAGWQSYARYYATGEFHWGKPEEFVDQIERLAALDLEPWGMANGLEFAEQLGLGDRVVSYQYGVIEGEPSFPTTNFSGKRAFEAGAQPGPRGVMGNAQTHCLQLPNTLAFARGARGATLTDDDYPELAARLLPGWEREISCAWWAMASRDEEEVRDATRVMGEAAAAAAQGAPQTGDLAGLLFGDPVRFLGDLAAQLEVRAACSGFVALAAEGGAGDPVPGDPVPGGEARAALGRFAAAASAWQRRHGYRNAWGWPRLRQALKGLGSPDLNRVLDPEPVGATPFEQVQSHYFRTETQTIRLLEAMARYAGRAGGP